MAITATPIKSVPVMYKVTVPSGTTGTEVITIKSSPLPTSNFYYTCQVKDSTGAEKASITSVYDKATGEMTVSSTLAYLDVVTIAGSWTTK
jgi:predicted carbohydrate-binding protein with CBM5 and CBM33 domain